MIKRIVIAFLFVLLGGVLWIYYSMRIVCTGEKLTASCFASRGTYEATFNEGWEELISKIEVNLCTNTEEAALIIGIGPLDTHPGEEQEEFFIRALSAQPKCMLEAIEKTDNEQFRNVVLLVQILRTYDMPEAIIAKKNILNLRENSEKAKILAKTLAP